MKNIRKFCTEFSAIFDSPLTDAHCEDLNTLQPENNSLNLTAEYPENSNELIDDMCGPAKNLKHFDAIIDDMCEMDVEMCEMDVDMCLTRDENEDNESMNFAFFSFLNFLWTLIIVVLRNFSCNE